jgi:OPT family oligopeptide transporter
MKVPPKTTFTAQVVAVIWASFVQIATMNWAMGTIPDICSMHQKNSFTCPNGSTFFSSSIVWGVIGPQRMFGPGSMYRPFLLYWLLGAVLPILFWILAKKFPKSFLIYLNAPVMLGALGYLPPATPLNYAAWGILGLTFNYYIRKRFKGWWQTYNYITAAALDSGLVICTIIIFFALTLPSVDPPQWWGNVAVLNTTVSVNLWQVLATHANIHCRTRLSRRLESRWLLVRHLDQRSGRSMVYSWYLKR